MQAGMQTPQSLFFKKDRSFAVHLVKKKPDNWAIALVVNFERKKKKNFRRRPRCIFPLNKSLRSLEARDGGFCISLRHPVLVLLFFKKNSSFAVYLAKKKPGDWAIALIVNFGKKKPEDGHGASFLLTNHSAV